MRLPVLTLALIVLGTGTGPAQSLRGQAPAATHIIDVSVTNAAGAPLETLRAEDLTLRIDGRVRPILDLRLIRHTEDPVLLPAAFATNQITPGRTMAVAIDITRLQQVHTAAVKDGISTLLAGLGARDRVAMVALATDGYATDYTNRHELIRAAAARLSGVAPATQEAKAAEEAAVASLALLERLCASLALEPGHKTLIFVAPPIGSASSIRRALQAVGAVTARQRIQLVVIDPSGGAPSSGLAALAAVTGGIVLPMADAFAAITDRSVVRYELRFTLTDDERNEREEKTHRVQVASLRNEAVVAAPPAFVVPKGGSTSEALVSLTDMLRQARVWRDLPLRLAVFPVLDTERDRLRLLVLGETEDATTLAWAEFALIAPSGGIVAQWKAEGTDVAIRPLMTAALAPPGPYRLRMAASELSGRRGTVDYEFDARLTPAGALAIGPLMFGGLAKDAFQPLLLPAPDAEAVMAYAEVYGVPAATDTLATRFEVAPTADGQAIASVAGSVRTTPSPDRRAALGTLDLTPLSPGDYVVRAIITLNGAEIGRVTRTLRKAAR